MDKGNSHERKYFDDVSRGYSRASKILLIAMAVIFVVTLLFNSSLLTYNNFSYLMRDISSAAELASGNYSSISYKNDEMRKTRSFRGGIITVSSTDLAIYTATGKRTLTVNENFVSPEISASKKYALVYDLGGNNYSVYNSFARIASGSFKYPISGGTASDSGWFALTTKDELHTSVVHLYDKDCNLRNTYSFASKYVFSVSISERGNRIAILTTEADGDKFATSVMICEPGKDEKKAEVRISDGLPYGSTFTTDGSLQVFCSDGMYLIDENDGSVKKSYSFNGMSINRVSITPDGAAVSAAGQKGVASNRILTFNKDGDMVFETTVDGGMLDLEYKDGFVFINKKGSVTRIDVKSGRTHTVKTVEDGTDIIVYDSGNILLCCQTKAVYIRL